MTQDEYEVGSLEDAEEFAIIRMAREAGFWTEKQQTWEKHEEWIGTSEELERFAALVAAHEREKTKAVFEELEREVKAELINAINGAVELEREACAKVCEDIPHNPDYVFGTDYAAAIRARTNKE